MWVRLVGSAGMDSPAWRRITMSTEMSGDNNGGTVTRTLRLIEKYELKS